MELKAAKPLARPAKKSPLILLRLDRVQLLSILMQVTLFLRFILLPLSNTVKIQNSATRISAKSDNFTKLIERIIYKFILPERAKHLH
jgi:hypothetical protein